LKGQPEPAPAYGAVPARRLRDVFMPELRFIFMLTRGDATLPNAAGAAREAIAAGARHIGFKDVGLLPAALEALAAQLKAAGATTYLEVVSLDEAGELASAELALKLGVDVLMGGVRPRAVGQRVKGANLRYFPFAGRVEGHPSVLTGSAKEIAASAREIAALPGVDGLDLLAYRSSHDGGELARQVCGTVGKPVVVAGSIDCPERVAAVRRAGAHAFTVGTAAIDGVFPNAAPGLGGQLAAIRAAARAGSA
jgi:4-hydroxythreonine-4-phosphate dehydrogenase